MYLWWMAWNIRTIAFVNKNIAISAKAYRCFRKKNEFLHSSPSCFSVSCCPFSFLFLFAFLLFFPVPYLSLSLCLSTSLFLCLSASLHLCPCVSVPVPLSRCTAVPLSLYLSIPCLCLTFSLPACLPACLSVCLTFYIRVPVQLWAIEVVRFHSFDHQTVAMFHNTDVRETQFDHEPLELVQTLLLYCYKSLQSGLFC